ncbi:SLC13 family permease [Rufibacter roseus]|uniref:SLC13 family permease n=1 Tax=Rufibacter roseus TaxID=1567108 RepID=A0ABW2DHP9_9BACT|nr:DASS family sodium-coupled anion symporter [Rufibacter roseus]
MNSTTFKASSFRNTLSLLLGPALFLLIINLSLPEGMTAEALAVLACTAWISTWWITEPIPIPATSLLPIVIFPLSGALGLNQTTSQYGNPIIFLFLGGFIVAIAMEKWNLHKRIALNIIHLVGTNQRKIVLGFMLATAFLSMWISNTATAMMMLPIGVSITMQLTSFSGEGPISAGNKFGKALMLGIAYSASIGGLATLVGTPANAILVAVVGQQFQMEISFLQWMLLGVPVTFVLLFICWFYLVRVSFPLHNEKSQNGKAEIESQLAILGRISTEEKWVLAVFAFTALAWLTRTFVLNRFFPELDDSMIAMFGAILLFLIPASSTQNKEKLLDWSIAEKIPWGILLLFGGGLAIALGFKDSGLAAWIGTKMTLLQGVSVLLIFLTIIAVINFLTEITSNTATATMMLPVLSSLALAIDIHPFGPMVAACMASSCAFMLPVATPPNAIVFGSGFIKMQDMIRTGFVLNLISVVVLTLAVYYLLPVVWHIDVLSLPAELKP